jgi:hypothetical protein
MLYPLSYEGITGFSSHKLESCCFHTSAQLFENYYSLGSTTPHYSSTWAVHNEYLIFWLGLLTQNLDGTFFTGGVCNFKADLDPRNWTAFVRVWSCTTRR